MEPMDDFMVMRRQLLSNSSDLVDTSISTSEFVTNLEVSIPVGVILILLYCLIRWYRPTLYEVRRTFAQVMALEEDHDSIDLAKERRDSQSKSQFIGHPELSSGYFWWIYEVWTMDTATFFKYAGLDALVFRMFLKGCVYMCLASMPYAFVILLPVYATGNEKQSDFLTSLTINNCASQSTRLWAAVIGEYMFIGIALYYLSKIYLVVAYAADQNFVGNAGNSESLRQIDTMTWFSYRRTLINVIEFNVNVVGTGISKVGTGISKVGAAVGSFVQATGVPQAIGLRSSQSEMEQQNDSNDNNNGISGISGISGKDGSAGPTSQQNDAAETTGLLKSVNYGSTDEMKDGGQDHDGKDKYVGRTAVSIDKYTVMIRDLPEKFQNEQTFEEFMKRLFPTQILKIWMLRDVRNLTVIYGDIQKHEEALRKLRRKYGAANVDSDDSEIMESTCCNACGSQENVVRQHKDELLALKRRFMIAREDLTTSPTAFVTFKDLQSAAICCTCPIRFGLYPLKIHQAPAPQDIRWQNLKYNSLQLAPNNVLAMFLFGLLLIFWTIPVTAIQALANLETVFGYIGVDLTKYFSSGTIDWLEGWVSVLVLDLFLLVLPNICEKITGLQRKASRGKEEILIMTKYYDCLVVMVLLITVLAGTLFSSWGSFSDGISDILDVLADNLASISTYFLLYVFLNAFIWLPLELFRPSYFLKSKLKMRDVNRFQYSKWYGKAMLILTICVTYSAMCPLVWIFGFFYFLFCVIVFSYQLSMAYIPDFETGAALWPAVFKRLTYTFNIGIATMIGLLFLKSFYVGGAVVFPLFLYNFLANRLSLQFRKVFRAASLTSASEKDNVLKSNNNNLEANWNSKLEMAYYPPIMDVDYTNDDPRATSPRNPISVEIENTNVSINAPATYQSDNLA